MCLSIDHLQLHLPNIQQIRYQTNQSLQDIVSNPRNSHTMLTEFFNMNIIDLARNYLYVEFPKYYRWIDTTHNWRRKQTNQKVLGRIYNVMRIEGEQFYLRLLLNHIRSPLSFEHLRMINGITFPTFKEAIKKLGLTINDDSIQECLREVCMKRMSSAIWWLFITIMVYCEPTRMHDLWDEFFPAMAEDYPSSSSVDNDFVFNSVLQGIYRLLK